MPVRFTLVFTLLLSGFLPFANGQQANNADCTQDNSSATGDCVQQKIKPHKEVIAVTGTFAPAPLETIDRSVSVLEVRDDSLLHEHWVDYLHADPSLDLRQRGPNSIQGDLSIRGSTFGQTLILLNGLRVNDVQSGHHNLDQPLPTPALQQIEVFKGAGSTFYGSDAFAGTVNFITASPSYSEIRAGSAIGNFGVNQQTASAGYTGKRWDEQLSLERDFSSGFRPDRDYRNLAAFSNTGAKSELGHTQIMLGYSDKPFGADQFYGDFNSWERTKAWFAGLKQDLGTKTEFDLGYRRHTDVFILFRDRPEIFSNDHIDESWQVALRRNERLGQNSTLYYGAEGFHDSVDSTNLGNHARSREAVYANWDMRALSRFSFSVGAREEFFGAGQAEFSPTVAGGVWLKAGLKLKASVGRAFRLPTYTDLYYHDPANLGNASLRPERGWSYEGGLQWDAGGRYRAGVTVFHRRDRDVIDYLLNSSNVYVATNIQSLNFTGVETSFESRLPHQQRVQVSYTGLYGAQQPIPNQQTRYSFNYPTHDAEVEWQGMLPGNFLARSRVGVVNRYKKDPYGLWDISVGREFHNVRAHLSLANVTDTRYQEIDRVIMPGRSVLFGMEFFWRAKRR